MKNIVLPVTPVLQGLLPDAEPDHQADDGQEQQTNSNGHAGPDRETSRCPQTAADHGGVAAPLANTLMAPATSPTAWATPFTTLRNEETSLYFKIFKSIQDTFILI